MTEERFAGMVQGSMEALLIKASFKSKAKTAFTLEAQQRRADNAVKGNALSDSPFNWNTEVILGRDADEYRINYRRCGLCALGGQEGLSHLVPHMCVLDIQSVEWMGACCTAPGRWLPAVTAVTSISVKRVPNGTGSAADTPLPADAVDPSKQRV